MMSLLIVCSTIIHCYVITGQKYRENTDVPLQIENIVVSLNFDKHVVHQNPGGVGSKKSPLGDL